VSKNILLSEINFTTRLELSIRDVIPRGSFYTMTLKDFYGQYYSDLIKTRCYGSKSETELKQLLFENGIIEQSTPKKLQTPSMQNIQIVSMTVTELEELIKKCVTDALSNFDFVALQSEKEEYCTRKEAASILRVALPTIDDYIKRGLIPASRVGSRIRIKKSDLKDSMNEVKSLKYKRD